MQRPPPRFTAALTSPVPVNDVVCAGWVLKKRRKKMQGFARRYFTLQQSGLLSYSFQPGEPTRDQIQLQQAAISTAPGRRDIHVDSNNATFHIKCLSEQDFETWMAAFRKFLARDSQTLGRRSSVARSISRTAQYSRTAALVEEMGNTITELENAFTAWPEEGSRKRSSRSLQQRGDKDKKDQLKDSARSTLGIFKKAAHGHHESVHDPARDSRASDASGSSSSAYHKLQTALTSLRQQHAALVKSLVVPLTIDMNTTVSRNATLATTAEEGGQTPTSQSQIHHRMSGISSNSEGSVWYDAPDGDGGAEEFVLDPSPGEEAQERKSLGRDQQSFAHSDTPTSTELDSDSDSESEQAGAPESAPTSVGEVQVVRRTHLPSGPVGDEGSLFAVLKKNVGKDLSQVALPVSFNEPLTLLQKVAEELEYYDILTQAAHATNPVDRMCFIAAFAVSTYANTKYRTGRKGFNPMLAETFEDTRMKFIAEKVSHNPVILAYHAEGEGWELYATSSGKTKFWGKSLEIIPQGTIHLRIGDEHFEWKRPSSFMRNIMMGTKYLEHCGKMVIENTTKGTQCVLDFKEGGYWGPANVVTGSILNASGETAAHLEGKWDEQMAQKIDSSHLHVLWRLTPFPKNAPEFYGFTSFGITLNEITPDLEGRLPPTDSRLRTDMRALEEGDLDLAESEKVRIEEMQRERRRKGAERRPRWFKQEGDEWIYVGGYWEQRAQGFKGVEPLW
ncbi:Oxysterol-binding protein-domain-containing protein [Amylocystis lapponica]|nr:Oxysterol-binding protein-domain-containing protein [Amylocystis lapponica]